MDSATGCVRKDIEYAAHTRKVQPSFITVSKQGALSSNHLGTLMGCFSSDDVLDAKRKHDQAKTQSEWKRLLRSHTGAYYSLRLACSHAAMSDWHEMRGRLEKPVVLTLWFSGIRFGAGGSLQVSETC